MVPNIAQHRHCGAAAVGFGAMAGGAVLQEQPVSRGGLFRFAGLVLEPLRWRRQLHGFGVVLRLAPAAREGLHVGDDGLQVVLGQLCEHAHAGARQPVADGVPKIVHRGQGAERSGAEFEQPFAERARPRLQAGTHLAVAISAHAVADPAVALVDVFALHVGIEVGQAQDVGRARTRRQAETAGDEGSERRTQGQAANKRLNPPSANRRQRHRALFLCRATRRLNPVSRG